MKIVVRSVTEQGTFSKTRMRTTTTTKNGYMKSTERRTRRFATGS